MKKELVKKAKTLGKMEPPCLVRFWRDFRNCSTVAQQVSFLPIKGPSKEVPLAVEGRSPWKGERNGFL